jgi:hypothetical protein
MNYSLHKQIHGKTNICSHDFSNQLLGHHQRDHHSPTSMESSTFPNNKRHAMLFRRSPTKQDTITASFPNPKTSRISPSNVSISTYHTPTTIEEALALPNAGATPPRPPPHRHNAPLPRQPLDRSQSSEYFLEIRKSPGPKEPQSRKTGQGQIHTEATATQPAFESDAFAVHAPATREPILDTPVYRAKLPSPSKAQVEAYQTYERKAQQVRERNNSEGVRVPSQLLSYDYGNTTWHEKSQSIEVEAEKLAPSSPPLFQTAGAFPISPPLQQHPWTQANHPAHSAAPQDQRSTSDSADISLARKPLGLGHTTPARTRFAQRSRGDTSTGASVSHSTAVKVTQTVTPTPSPSKIKIRLKPRGAPPAAPPPAPPSPEERPEERPQKESFWSLYTRTPPQSSTPATSRSPSPAKSAESTQFKYTTTANVSAGAAEALFGYPTNSMTGTHAPDKSTKKHSSKKEKEKEKDGDKDGEPKISRWAWLRPAGPRVGKHTSTSTTPAEASTTRGLSKPLTISAPVQSVYIDPFVTPAPSLRLPTRHTPSPPPRKLRALPLHPPSTTSKKKVESGFAQVTWLGSLILKICLVVYICVGLYFVLDAVREAVFVISAPFRVLRYLAAWLWVGVAWVGGYLAAAWVKWGFRVVPAKEGWW